MLHSALTVAGAHPVVPVCGAELRASGSVAPFLGGGEVESLLLDEERGRLLLGTRDHVFLLDLEQLNRNPRQVLRHTESRPRVYHPQSSSR